MGVLTILAPTVSASASATLPSAPRIDLRVLVVDDGSPMVDALATRLAAEGVPATRLDVTSADRAAITRTYLTVPDLKGPHARFQGVILPTHSPAQLSADEMRALWSFERDFGVREVSAYSYPSTNVGLNPPVYAGVVDGLEATVTPAARASGFGYLAGKVALDDISPTVSESYGYLASPAAAPPAGVSFTPFLTAAAPGMTEPGVLLGVLADQGREELVSTFASNPSQQHIAYLAPGIVEWLTRGIHLGLYRNYFSVHADDVFLPDAKWSVAGNCTIGDGCDPGLYPEAGPGAEVRMQATDVRRLEDWQDAHGFRIDLAYNGGGVAQHKEQYGVDPLYTAFVADRVDFDWINHTFEHPYLGCVQDFSVSPWRCATNVDGSTRWVGESYIEDQIRQNRSFAIANGLPFDPRELVTGEHSGLASLPQMPTDNPNLGNALHDTNIAWVASDASRERAQRRILDTLTVPRHPMNIFYNVSTIQEQVDEYNWIYTRRADGGSGLCEELTGTTCIEPLDLDSGFDEYIAPLEARIALRHATTNDPRPHYAHQSNLADDAVLYPVLDRVLMAYRSTFGASTPLVNPSMTEAGVVLARQAAWAAQSQVTATLVGTTVTIFNAGREMTAPVTAPEGTRLGGNVWGEPYAGGRSAWSRLRADSRLVLALPGASGYRTPAGVGSTAGFSSGSSGDTLVGPTTIEIEEPAAEDRAAVASRTGER